MSKPELPIITSRTLTYTHQIPILRVKKFWDGLKEGKIYATKCKKCGEIYYPPQADCTSCLTSDMEWIEVPNEGYIETFVASYLKPQGFEHYETPYIIAIARTESGIKVMGFLEKVDYKEVKPGMKVKITSRIQNDGFPAIIFEPIT